MGGNPIAFDFNFGMLMIQIIYLSLFFFSIYFLVCVVKFMKRKIALDEQRIEQNKRFIELYKSTNDIK